MNILYNHTLSYHQKCSFAPNLLSKYLDLENSKQKYIIFFSRQMFECPHPVVIFKNVVFAHISSLSSWI